MKAWARIMYSIRRRGQANIVTVAILVGATLAMALALLSYFTGQASRASEERGLSDYLATLSYNIDTTIVARYSYAANDYTGYCYVVQVAWTQSTPVRLYLTVLPASRVSPELVNVDTNLLKYIPRDIVINPGSPEQSVYLFLVSDVDADGIVELVGKGNTVVSEYLPSCYEIYEMLTNGTLQLYEILPINTPMENLYLTPDITLKAFADQAGISYEVPVWSLEFSIDERVRDLFIFIKVPTGVDADSLNLIFLGIFKNNYYASYYAPLPPP